MPDHAQQLVAQFNSSWAEVVAISVFVLLSLTAWGFALLQRFPKLRINWSPLSLFCESFLHGFLFFSVVSFSGILLGVRIYQTFFFFSALIVLIWLTSRWYPYTVKALVDQKFTSTSNGRKQSLALILIVVGSLLWSTNSIRGLEVSGDRILLVPWVDFFYHARQIGNFGQFRGDLGTLNLVMYGEPMVLYHYCSYMVSSLVSDMGGIPSLQIATSLFPVLGMLLTGASIFVLASISGGTAATFLAVFLLFFLPDPSFWVSGMNRLRSYFFFQQVGVGGAYAIAIMGFALAYALQAIKLRSSIFCLVSLFIFSLAALFKATIFLAYSFFFFIVVILSAVWVSKERRLACACVFLIAFYLAIWKLNQMQNAPTFNITLAGIEKNVEYVTNFIHSSDPPFLITLASLPVTAIGVFFITYGALFPASAFLAWKLRNDPSVRTMLWLLVLGFVSHASIRLLIANNEGPGDVAEVNRKTFVLPYFLIVFSFSSLLSTYLSRENSTSLLRKLFIFVLCCCLILFSAMSAMNVQSWVGLRNYYTNIQIPTGLFESAAYLREHAKRSEVVQLCENDEFNQLGTLAERPVYIAKLVIGARATSAREQERFAVVDLILRQSDSNIARSLMRQVKISWFLMSPKCSAAWETDSAPVFSTVGYRLHKSR